MKLAALAALALALPLCAQSPDATATLHLDQLPSDRYLSDITPVHEYYGPMPTGVTVSREGRIFVCYPKWGDPVKFTVGEIRNGQEVAYPSQQFNDSTLVSVQSVVIDPQNRLWLLDTGSVMLGPTQPGGAKLIGIDIATGQVVKSIVFPSNVALPTSYLNDVRFDLQRGSGGTAYITDSSGTTPAILVVDLATGQARRRLVDSLSVMPEPGFKPVVEGRVLAIRPAHGQPQPLEMGADGIAISADGSTLYYCPLSSRRLYAIRTDLLADPNVSEAALAAAVQDLGEKGASDGLQSDAQGNVYLSGVEGNGIVMMKPNQDKITIVHDPHVLWPDTLAVGYDGYLYFNANQFERQPRYHWGQDQRVKPYTLFRVKINGTPVER